jgi:hypothetical protein
MMLLQGLAMRCPRAATVGLKMENLTSSEIFLTFRIGNSDATNMQLSLVYNLIIHHELRL